MSPDNKELHLAKDFIEETGCNVFLTGKAGTGKTTFLHDLKQTCKKRTVVTAPTGVAAINAGGVTLHSFFQMPFGPFVPGSDRNRQHKFNREKINLIKSLDLLIIDEISMVRADLLDGIDSVLRRYRRSNQPFGGVQLLLIGDLHQLAPVVKNEDWRILGQYYDSPYFFSSKALAGAELISIELQHIYRQADGEFIELLNRVRDNKLDETTLANLNNRYDKNFQHTSDGHDGYITLCSHNSLADTINDSKLKGITVKSQWFNAEIEGEFPEHSYPTPLSLELKQGAQVMFVRNDASYEKRYFNGKIGKIVRIKKDQIWIRCPGDVEDILVEPSTWENIDYKLDEETMEVTEDKIGAFVQYPLKLAWAITIHKSQGLTFDNAVIDAQAAFAHGQVYVALSRCRTLEGMILSSPLSRQSIKMDRAVLKFTENSGKNLPSAEKLERAKIKYQQSLLLDCFDFNRLQIHLRKLCNLVERNSGLLRIDGGGNLQDLQQETTTNICRVGYNFAQQLVGLFKDDLLPSLDAVVTERLQKASDYFQKEMGKNLLSAVAALEVDTDNKDLRRQSKRIISQLQEEAGVKLAAVKCCEKNFSAAHYLKQISSAEILTKPKPAKNISVTYTESDITHPKLYESLKKWRTAKAKNKNLAPFQILHQKTLIQITVNLPATLAELKTIKGIGEKLSSQYGEEIIDKVISYRKKLGIKEVQLPTPMELPVILDDKKGKKDSHQLSFELFNKNMSPKEIAKERGITLVTVEKHLAKYVASGELPLDKLVDAVKQQTIEEYLLQNAHIKLKEIKEALGKDISYGEIKFVQAYLEYSSS